MPNIDLRLGNCLDIMKTLPSELVDLTVTSPPYDKVRDYQGFSFNFPDIAKELYRITKQGGVVVWIVGDGYEDGSETLTSFKHALYFKEIGFKVHDTMIYKKKNGLRLGSLKTYMQKFEYMFVLVKDEIKTVNLIRDRPIRYKEMDGKNTTRETNGTQKKLPEKILPDFGPRHNIWEYVTGIPHSTRDKFAYEHPAIFPENLAKDHILSWSNEGDVVFDPMMGSGTVAKMARMLKRNFIGIEISEKYFEIAKRRCSVVQEVITN